MLKPLYYIYLLSFKSHLIIFISQLLFLKVDIQTRVLILIYIIIN